MCDLISPVPTKDIEIQAKVHQLLEAYSLSSLTSFPMLPKPRAIVHHGYTIQMAHLIIQHKEMAMVLDGGSKVSYQTTLIDRHLPLIHIVKG